jgi:hypothetical protein
VEISVTHLLNPPALVARRDIQVERRGTHLLNPPALVARRDIQVERVANHHPLDADVVLRGYEDIGNCSRTARNLENYFSVQTRNDDDS